MPGGTFKVSVVAKDDASGVLATINRNLMAVNKQVATARAPMDRLAKSYSRFTQLTGVGRIASGLGGVARSGLQAFQSVSRIVEPLAAISGAASIAGMMKLATAWADFAVHLGGTAARAGMSTDQLQLFQNAGMRAGVSAEATAGGLTTLHDNLTKFTKGTAPTEFVQLMNLWHVSIDDARRMANNMSEALPFFAERIGGYKDATTQALFAQIAFSGSGEAMLPLFRLQAAGLQELVERSRKYGLVTRDQVEAATKLRNAQLDVTAAVNGLGYAVSAELAPVFTPLLTDMADFIEQNKKLIATDIGSFFRGVATEMKNVDFSRIGGAALVVGNAFGSIGRTVGPVALSVIEWCDKMGLSSFALGTILTIRLLGPLRGIAARLAMLAAFSPPAWMLAFMGYSGAKAGKMGVPMVDDLGRPIGNWGGDGGARKWDMEHGQPSDYPGDARHYGGPMPTSDNDFTPLGTLLLRKLGILGAGTAPNGVPAVGVSFGSPPPGGNPVVMPGNLAAARTLPPEARALLDTISGPESQGDYSIINGGSHFSDMSHHPNWLNPASNSTAAGRYQFIRGTWDNASKAAGGLHDFTPESQDRGAWAIAQQTYQQKTHRDLLTDLRNPSQFGAIQSALGGTDLWTSLNMSGFAANLAREQSNGPALALPGGSSAATNGSGASPSSSSDNKVSINVKVDAPDNTRVIATQSGPGLAPLKVERSSVGDYQGGASSH